MDKSPLGIFVNEINQIENFSGIWGKGKTLVNQSLVKNKETNVIVNSKISFLTFFI